MEPIPQIMFYEQLATSDTICKWTLAPDVGQLYVGALTDVEPGHWGGPAIEHMCQIMFYNELPPSDTIHKWTLSLKVGRFHISALTDVKPGHWGGHQVSGHGTDVSNHVL